MVWHGAKVVTGVWCIEMVLSCVRNAAGDRQVCMCMRSVVQYVCANRVMIA